MLYSRPFFAPSSPNNGGAYARIAPRQLAHQRREQRRLRVLPSQAKGTSYLLHSHMISCLTLSRRLFLSRMPPPDCQQRIRNAPTSSNSLYKTTTMHTGRPAPPSQQSPPRIGKHLAHSHSRRPHRRGNKSQQTRGSRAQPMTQTGRAARVVLSNLARQPAARMTRFNRKISISACLRSASL